MSQSSKKSEGAKGVAVSIPRVAQHLGISPGVLYRAVERGDLKVLKVGQRYLLSRQVVNEWLAAAGMPTAE